MDTALCVLHPLDVINLVNTGRVNILSETTCGPLGLVMYNIEYDVDMTDDITDLCAVPYAFSISTDILEYYSQPNYLEMLKLYLYKILGAQPDDFEITRYKQPRTTYIYPMYISQDSIEMGKFKIGSGICDYLYVTPRERGLIETDTISMLGFFPFSNDPKCLEVLSEHKLLQAFTEWGGACLLKTENTYPVNVDMADKVAENVEHLRRLGLIE